MSIDYTNKLHEIRKAEGLTQKQFADLTGISLGTIKNYETGQHAATALTAEKVLGVENLQKYTLWLMTNKTAPESGQIAPPLSLDGPQTTPTSRRSTRKIG
ncbi:helix-turn-helix transcriptional regulator [Yersinia enterocolitica]|uniref:helix-turn-helix transcriptional regulator n=1 Tax=Yersinia enterocolitica TaxID=630 RepID=UPI001C608690|nr:helix-turn-helix transcriptional regulator [Yersinia enterocolitica]MBW5878398.1 helix-turn-helix domain-containing protein [Yersinia enterocolitica]